MDLILDIVGDDVYSIIDEYASTILVLYDGEVGYLLNTVDMYIYLDRIDSDVIQRIPIDEYQKVDDYII